MYQVQSDLPSTLYFFFLYSNLYLCIYSFIQALHVPSPVWPALNSLFLFSLFKSVSMYLFIYPPKCSLTCPQLSIYLIPALFKYVVFYFIQGLNSLFLELLHGLFLFLFIQVCIFNSRPACTKSSLTYPQVFISLIPGILFIQVCIPNSRPALNSLFLFSLFKSESMYLFIYPPQVQSDLPSSLYLFKYVYVVFYLFQSGFLVQGLHVPSPVWPTLNFLFIYWRPVCTQVQSDQP